MSDERGDKDVASVKEAEMRSSRITDYVNDNDDTVSGFDGYNCSSDNFYDIF